MDAITQTVMTYRDALSLAMADLAMRADTIFMGQAVAFPGTAMTQTFKYVPRHKLLELPVAEEMQLGMALGMAFDGRLPVCVYPRFNFLLRAFDQLVNHLDKVPEFGNGWRSRVIVRTAVATDRPLHPGSQHLGDFGLQVRQMTRHIDVEYVSDARSVLRAYAAAAESERSTIVVEFHDLYDREFPC